MKLPNSIVIIESYDISAPAIHVFTDDAESRAEAAELFMRIARDQKSDDGVTPMFTEEQIAEGWEGGWMSDLDTGSGDWTLSFHTAEP